MVQETGFLAQFLKRPKEDLVRTKRRELVPSRQMNEIFERFHRAKSVVPPCNSLEANPVLLWPTVPLYLGNTYFHPITGEYHLRLKHRLERIRPTTQKENSCGRQTALFIDFGRTRRPEFFKVPDGQRARLAFFFPHAVQRVSDVMELTEGVEEEMPFILVGGKDGGQVGM